MRSNHKMIPTLPDDNVMKCGDMHLQYSEKGKWKDNCSVVPQTPNISNADSESSVSHHMKGSSSKIGISCPELVKKYNKGMEGVHLLDQLTASNCLDRRLKTQYYLCFFFDLWDMALVNSYHIYSTLTGNKMLHLDFKVSLAEGLIANFNSRK